VNVIALMRAARERFRVRISGVDAENRARLAEAARAFGRELEPIDYAKSVAMRELAELLDVPRQAARTEGPPTDRYAQPPDMEGDEYLRARSPRALRRPTEEGEPR